MAINKCFACYTPIDGSKGYLCEKHATLYHNAILRVNVPATKKLVADAVARREADAVARREAAAKAGKP